MLVYQREAPRHSMADVNDTSHLKNPVDYNCRYGAITLHDSSSSQTMVASPASPSSVIEATEDLQHHSINDTINHELGAAGSDDHSRVAASRDQVKSGDSKIRKFFETFKNAFKHPIERPPAMQAMMTVSDPLSSSKLIPANQPQAPPRQVVTLNELSYADPCNEQAQVVASAYGDSPIPPSPNTQQVEEGGGGGHCERRPSESSKIWKRRISLKRKSKEKGKSKDEMQENRRSNTDSMSPENEAMAACIRYCAVIDLHRRTAGTS